MDEISFLKDTTIPKKPNGDTRVQCVLVQRGKMSNFRFGDQDSDLMPARGAEIIVTQDFDKCGRGAHVAETISN